MGVGLENGTIILHNLKFDETLMKFHQEWGPVTSLSFRTGMSTCGIEKDEFFSCFFSYSSSLPSLPLALSCDTDGINTVASASPIGHIAVWSLDHRRLGAVLRDAHNGSVCGMEFLSSQPLLVTSGPDNS